MVEEGQGISRPLRVRMGINTGYCTVGNFGSAMRLDYTIVGGEVNLASRLESAAEPDQILISHHTYALIRDRVACTERGEMTVKGIAHPIQTYQVLGFAETEAQTGRRLTNESQGFSISVAFDEIADGDRADVAATLREALEKLDS